jgi:hypothetical protein
MKKLIPWIIVLILLVVLGAGAYFWIIKPDVSVSGSQLEGIAGFRPLDMRISEVRSDSFVVEWETKSEVVGYIKYGDTSTALPLMAQDEKGSEPCKSHRVVVDGLQPGRKYYFWVMSDNVAFGKDNRALEVLTLSQD